MVVVSWNKQETPLSHLEGGRGVVATNKNNESPLARDGGGGVGVVTQNELVVINHHIV